MYRSILILLCVLPMAAVAADDSELPGLKIGAKAPDFELSAQNKKKVKLSKLLKRGPVAVVFHRSASW